MVKFAISEDSEKSPVKLEIEDSLEDEHGPFLKKHKQFQAYDQFNAGNNLFPAQPSQYNPLDEPSPLGLRLRKSPSLLELIQMRLSQGKSSTLKPTTCDDFNTREKTNTRNSSASTAAADKLKASNFPASLLRIGDWEYSSQHEGDLVAKCYFAKHKLVWEILDGGLKNKIEIQWSDIMGLKADLPEEAPATLIVVLARQPLFFRETNPQPRKHTLWQATTDFTDDQASFHRKHFLQVPNGLLNKHFEKLIQCDVRLNFLSHQPQITLDSPYFESKPPIFDQRESCKETSVSIFEDIATPSASHSQSSSISVKLEDALNSSTGIPSYEATSPSSVDGKFSISAMPASKSSDAKILKNSKSFEQLIIQGIHSSMSMNDLVNHIGSCMTSENLSFTENESESESLKTLEDISQHLLGDFQFTSSSDEKSLMSRVNSLCSLIQKDGTPAQSFQVSEEGKDATPASHELETTTLSGVKPDTSALEGGSKDVSGCKRVPSMARIDSFGDLLLQLPRIASLPKFLFDISEDGDNQAR
ncbi:hypothetical protein KSS87_008991 [Heliosperma pusillum]|nr:hypothetical protein KSS87_016622 [Heliosperma pusillum]KAH9611952.1 hypothetical protein KSS87_008991 [Heliosperma pusillum]